MLFESRRKKPPFAKPPRLFELIVADETAGGEVAKFKVRPSPLDTETDPAFPDSNNTASANIANDNRLIPEIAFLCNKREYHKHYESIRRGRQFEMQWQCNYSVPTPKS